MWLKKAQQALSQAEMQIVRNILDTNDDLEIIRQKLQQSVGNPCAILEMLCNGEVVPPLYMTVWQQFCGGSENGEQGEQADQA